MMAKSPTCRIALDPMLLRKVLATGIFQIGFTCIVHVMLFRSQRRQDGTVMLIAKLHPLIGYHTHIPLTPISSKQDLRTYLASA